MGTSGTNLTNGTIKIGDVLADDRLRVGGILYLEDRLGKSFEEIADDLTKAFDGDKIMMSTMVRKMLPVILALVQQRNPDMTDDNLLVVERTLLRFELEDFTHIFDKVKMFGSAKNEETPTSGKPRKRTKVVRTPRA